MSMVNLTDIEDKKCGPLFKCGNVTSLVKIVLTNLVR